MTQLSLKDTLKANQKRIVELSNSIPLYLNTVHGSKREVRAQIEVLKDRLDFRLKQLETQGQEAKIAMMEEALAILKPPAA